MKLKHLLLISAVAMSFAACDDDDDVKKNDNETSGKILFSTTVTNPDGSSGSGYLLTASNFEGGVNYTNSNAVPLVLARILACVRVEISMFFPTIWAAQN